MLSFLFPRSRMLLIMRLRCSVGLYRVYLARRAEQKQQAAHPHSMHTSTRCVTQQTGHQCTAAVLLLRCCPRRQLWQRSWRAVLHHTPLQDLAAARAASRAAGGEPAQFEEAVRASALFVAIYRAAQALADAGQVQVGCVGAAAWCGFVQDTVAVKCKGWRRCGVSCSFWCCNMSCVPDTGVHMGCPAAVCGSGRKQYAEWGDCR